MRLKKALCLLVSCVMLTVSLPVRAGDAATSFDGSGMTVAILDRGFDLSHESFVITDSSPRLTKERSDALLESTSLSKLENMPETLYVNAKIPFAYDYGDNDADVSDALLGASGTNLLSIAAGNGKMLENEAAGATGIAPEAQVLAMKVHSTATGDVSADAMVSAIGDAVMLGADVILIGIVSMEGYGSEQAMSEVNRAIENAEAAGVIVVCSAGSVTTYGSGSTLEEEYGENLISADSPDTGTVAWPGCLKSTLAVTSADANTIISDFFTLSDGTKIPYGDSNYMFTTTTNGVSFDKFFDGKTLEYVLIGGKGSAENMAAAGEISGKLALVERGDITFVEKAKNAADAGALGIIVIDNQADKDSALTLLMDLTDAPIPAVMISSANGVLLKTAADKRISITDGESYTTYTRQTPFVSNNAVSGPTPELSLKPDIAALGDSVECATVQNGYTSISSSRAAAAKVAGMCLLAKARIQRTHPSADAATLMSLTRALLVCSAENMRYLSGSLYSPRIQGGGAADIDAALTSSLVLTSNTSHKIELGEVNSPILKLRVTAHNLSNTAKVCTLDAIVGADSYEEINFAELGCESGGTETFLGRFTELSGPKVMLGDFMYQLNHASEAYEPYTFTLAPGASESFTVTLYLDEETCNNYRESFKNGFFIEGYMRLSTEGETASIPYLGFVGDYSASPSLDASVYGEDQYIYDASYFYRHRSTSGGKLKSVLGAQLIGTEAVYNARQIVFSPVYDRANAGVYLNLGLLRSITDVCVSVRASDGSVVCTQRIDSLMRTHMSSSTGRLTSPQIYIWDGRATDNPSYVYPDGEYTVCISYRAPCSDTPREITYTLHLDKSAPTLSSYEFSTVGDCSALSVSAKDNFALSRISVTDSAGTYAAEISDGIWDTSNLTGKYIYIEIHDLASNMTVARVANPVYEPES